MDRALSDVIIAVGVILTVTSGGLVAYWMSLRSNRELRRETVADGESLQAQLDDLRAELGAQIAELQDRVDFAERLLARQHDPAALPEPMDQDTPREL